MQVIEIRSQHDLTARVPTERRTQAHSYWLHCRQFNSEFKAWLKGHEPQEATLGLMTLAMERIFLTQEESQEVAQAITDASSPKLLD